MMCVHMLNNVWLNVYVPRAVAVFRILYDWIIITAIYSIVSNDAISENVEDFICMNNSNGKYWYTSIYFTVESFSPFFMFTFTATFLLATRLFQYEQTPGTIQNATK